MQVKFTRCNASQVANVSLVEGQLVYAIDTGDVYVDTSSERTKVSDIVKVASTAEITSPNEDKLYVVNDGSIYTYNGSELVDLSTVEGTNIAFSYSGITATTVDGAIKELKDDISNMGTQSEIEELQDDVSTLKTNVSANTTNIATNTTAIEGLQETIANKEHFRGYYSTIAEIEVISGEAGDYAYCAEDGYKYTYTDGVWTKTTETVPDQTVPKSSTTPLMNGTANVGSETSYAAGDHVHPTDTTRASQADLDTLETQVETNTTNIANKVDKEDGKVLSSNDYTDEEKTKLAGIEESANNYTLPTASTTTLGGIKVGDNLTIVDGVLSANAQAYDVATETTDGLMSAEDKTKLDGLENYDDTDLTTRVSDLETQVSTNTTDIATNKANIETNTSDIADIKAVLEWNEVV